MCVCENKRYTEPFYLQWFVLVFCKFVVYIFSLRCVGIIYHQVFGIGGFVSDAVICQLSLLQVFLFI